MTPEPYEFEIWGTKVCTGCGYPLPRNSDYFTVDRSRLDGLTSRCRDCRTKDSAAYRAAHLDECRARQRAYMRRRAGAT